MIEDLNKLYDKYNKVEYIHPDPLETLYKYESKEDQEVVGLIASSFAVGNVKAILKFLYSVFDEMGNSPYKYLRFSSDEKIISDFSGFYYRYYNSEKVVEFFTKIKYLLVRYATLENWVMNSYNPKDETISPSMKRLSNDLSLSSSLIPKGSGNSGFKRLALYFRWMVREDNVDLGLWKKIDSSKLIIPLDTHIMNISHILGFTKSKSNSMSNALKITGEFRKIYFEDPVKWDFALSRLGIHPDLSYEELFNLF